MNINWKKYSLYDVFEIIGGGTPKTSRKDFWNGSIPWLSVVDFNNDIRTVSHTEKSITQLGLEKSSTKILEKGQIIISARGTVGEIAQLSKPMAFNQSCYGLIGRNGILENDFGYYLLKNSINDLKSNSHGSVFDTITRKTFENIKINLPPLPEQRAIASILSNLDDKIENNLAINKTLEEMAMALYKHWFVDFGPFQEGKFVESELGMIPEGWEVSDLRALIELNPRLKLSKGTIAKFVDMKSLPLDMMSVSNIDEKVYNGGTKFQKEDTLLARITPCLENGKTAYVDFLDDNEVAFGSTEFLILRAKKGYSKYWNYCLSRMEDFRSHAISCMVGTSGRQRVQNDPLMNFKIPKAPTKVYQEFDRKVDYLFKKIRQNTIENQTLQSRRDALLPKLVSGEVRVKGFG